jgi:hypothetical protein
MLETSAEQGQGGDAGKWWREKHYSPREPAGGDDNCNNANYANTDPASVSSINPTTAADSLTMRRNVFRPRGESMVEEVTQRSENAYDQSLVDAQQNAEQNAYNQNTEQNVQKKSPKPQQRGNKQPVVPSRNNLSLLIALKYVGVALNSVGITHGPHKAHLSEVVLSCWNPIAQ